MSSRQLRNDEIMQIEHILLHPPDDFHNQNGNETMHGNETRRNKIQIRYDNREAGDLWRGGLNRNETSSGNETRCENETPARETLAEVENEFSETFIMSDSDWDESLLENRTSTLADIAAACGSPIDLTGIDSPVRAGEKSQVAVVQKEKKPMRKTKVYIKDPEMQTLLVRMCISPFPELSEKGSTKKKFWEVMRQEYWKETGIDAIVMGCMKTWEDERRKAVEKKNGRAGWQKRKQRKIKLSIYKFN